MDGTFTEIQSSHLGVPYFCNMPVLELYLTLKLKLESAMDKLCRSWGQRQQAW